MAKIHPDVTIARVYDAIEGYLGFCYLGFCLECGADASNVEPLARRYTCESCGKSSVYGAEEILLIMAAERCVVPPMRVWLRYCRRLRITPLSPVFRGFAPGVSLTKRDLQRLVRDASFPYAIQYRTDDGEFKRHSYIQTTADERVFLTFANRKAQYRIEHSADFDAAQPVASCANCEGRFTADKLLPIKDAFERVAPGELMPLGECPNCGALCHAVEADKGGA